MSQLAAFLAPLFKAFWQAYFEAYQNAQFVHIEKVTDADKADLQKFKDKLRSDGVAGPDDWLPGTARITGLHETAPDREPGAG